MKKIDTKKKLEEMKFKHKKLSNAWDSVDMNYTLLLSSYYGGAIAGVTGMVTLVCLVGGWLLFPPVAIIAFVASVIGGAGLGVTVCTKLPKAIINALSVRLKKKINRFELLHAKELGEVSDVVVEGNIQTPINAEIDKCVSNISAISTDLSLAKVNGDKKLLKEKATELKEENRLLARLIKLNKMVEKLEQTKQNSPQLVNEEVIESDTLNEV